jgi:hypothetical protein
MDDVHVVIPDSPTFRCPMCDARVHWSCGGKVGIAQCSNGPNVTRVFKRGEPLNVKICTWEGKVERRPDGNVEIYY